MNSSNKTYLVILTLVFSLGLFIGEFSLVSAQEVSDYEFTLEEITVTAQKREENQQKVPIAMEVISGDVLKEVGRNDIDEILNNVSSVLVQGATDGLRVSIRGISNDNDPFQNIQASTPTVAVNTDGIYTNRNNGNSNMYDVERVEVLFGPQSTLYASASPGGIVNVVTADPKTDKFEGSGSIGYGNYNHLQTEAAMNVPVNDKVALRAAFTTSVHDGYLSNGSMDEDDKSGRLKALFQPNDKFSIVLTGEIDKSVGQGFANVEAFVDQDDVDDPWESEDENAGLDRDMTRKRFSAKINSDFGYIGTLSILPSYSKNTSYSYGSEAGNAAEGEEAATYETKRIGDGNEKGIEVRMASSAEFPFQWILGGNIYKSEDNHVTYQTNVELDTDMQDVYTTNEQDTKAIYANITYPFTDRLRVTGGIRQSWDENTTVNTEIPGKFGASETIDGSHMKYDKPNYKLGFEYDLSDNSMLFVDWSTSYRMNGVGTTPEGVTLDTEELMAYSVGSKNRFFGNKLQLNASAYYYDYTNYLANMTGSRLPIDLDGDNEWDPDTETELEEVVNIETGDATVYGFDIQTSTIITSKDKLDFSVSYIKKYFTDLYFDFPEMLNWFGIEDLDYSDRDMPQAPHWNVTANYSHNFMFPNGGTLTPQIEFRFTSKTCLNWIAKSLSLTLETDDDGNYTGGYNATVTDTSDVRWQEAYYLVNLSMVYADPSGKWTLSAYVNNVENYAVKRFLNFTGNLTIGNPRTYGAVLSVKY